MATDLPDDSRASVDSDMSLGEYNRIRLDESFRDKILAEFNDSVESLPLPVNMSEDSPSTSPPQKPAPQQNLSPLQTSPPASKAKAPSRLNQVVQSSDIPTPKASQLNDPFNRKSLDTPTGSNDVTSTPTSSKGNLSKISTAEDTDGKSPKEGRPGPMRRITSKIKRTISSKG